MCESSLVLVTKSAYLKAIAFEQGHVIATVREMTIRTFIDASVFKGAVPVLVN